jgi:hypothetical protein
MSTVFGAPDHAAQLDLLPAPDPAAALPAVLAEATRQHRPFLEWLYGEWDYVNRRFFDGTMRRPLIRLASDLPPAIFGQYGPRPGGRLPPEICLRAEFAIGLPAPGWVDDPLALGRLRLMRDVLLHEAVHLHVEEVIGAFEDRHRGHGPVFARECNRIGRQLSLPPVRPTQAPKRERHLRSCAYWPHCVRPFEYYLWAEEEISRRAGLCGGRRSTW